MKQKLLIARNDQVVYKGKLTNIPVKEHYIITKSVELFDDDDPCIIHTSFVIKHFAKALLSLFNEAQNNVIVGKDYVEQLDFLDVDDVHSVTLSLL